MSDRSADPPRGSAREGHGTPSEEQGNRFLADRRWQQLFDELRITLRELRDLEPHVVDAGASEEEWTKAWGQYAGLLSRIGHLQQQLLRRRVELMDLTRGPREPT